MIAENKNQENKFSLSLKEHEEFNRLALAAVRSLAGNSGIITAKVKSPGLKDSSIRITSKLKQEQQTIDIRRIEIQPQIIEVLFGQGSKDGLISKKRRRY